MKPKPGQGSQEPSLAMYESMLAELQTLIDSSRALIISGVTISEELPHFAEVLVIATGIPPDAQSEPSAPPWATVCALSRLEYFSFNGVPFTLASYYRWEKSRHTAALYSPHTA